MVDLLRLQGRLAEARVLADSVLAHDLGVVALASLRAARGVVNQYLGQLDDALADYSAARTALEEAGDGELAGPEGATL